MFCRAGFHSPGWSGQLPLVTQKEEQCSSPHAPLVPIVLPTSLHRTTRLIVLL